MLDAVPMVTLVVSLAASLMMTGLVWFVQVVHYPLFATVGRKEFTAYASRHSRQTSVVVVPLMLLELATGIMLLVNPPDTLSSVGALAQFLLLVALWLSTFAVQVPLHRRLGRGLDKPTVTKLVRTNWLRTALWSARSLILLSVLL